jgi:bifunctional aspartokinase / homoserine dehydrogenase 1
MKVMKFGGSSVASPESIRKVVAIVAAAGRPGEIVVVVSALGGVTDALLDAAEAAARGEAASLDAWRAIGERHRQAAVALASRAEIEPLTARLEELLDELKDLLRGVLLVRECSPRTRDSILSYGERLAAPLVAAALRAAGIPASARDAREVVVTDAAFGRAHVDFDATLPRVAASLGGLTDVPVFTGFIGATPAGETTTLGRGGSDYSAAILGAGGRAERIEIWTDVDGVMSADPRLVPTAFSLDHLTYSELMELSHFGAKVVYPPTVHPARQLGIPIVIRNTFNPSFQGTQVLADAPPSLHPVRGISSINDVAMMRLEGDGMVGVPGIAMRLFGALARQGISAILISQASSEHSICFAVAPQDAERTGAAVAAEFALERQAGLVDELVVEKGMAVVAAVGEAMRERPGIAGRLFGVLGAHGVNVRAIAQGSSELNISLILGKGDEARALAAIHGSLFTPHRREVELAVVGVGRVGSVFLDQVRSAAPALERDEELVVRVVAIVNSRQMIVDRAGIDLDAWRERLAAGEASNLPRLAAALARPRGTARVLVDCTASPEVGASYASCLAHGVGVVAANKRPFSGPFSAFRALVSRASADHVPLRFETTVGAGLPVLSTLDDLRRTGDRIVRIDGVLSGTLNFVLDRLDAGESLSLAVRQAYDEGLTEPHPYDDLSGEDVRRKLCILARLSGLALEPAAIGLEPLLPGVGWGEMSLEEFWRELPRLDADFAERARRARGEGRRLRYVGSVGDSQAQVRIEAVPATHPCFDVRGPENIVAFLTERYGRIPLVVRGPGAGPEVTAAGVFADVLRAVEQIRDLSPVWPRTDE